MTRDRDELASDPRNLWMVIALAKRVHAKLPPSFDLEDLIGVGNAALLTAAERFDPQRSTPFLIFARFVVRGAILDSCRRKHYTENTRPSIAGTNDIRQIEADEYFDLEKYGPEGARALFRIATRPAPEDSIDRDRLKRRISSAIGRLPAEQQQVLAAAFALDLSIREIGIRFAIPRGRARRLRTDAIAAVRIQLMAAAQRKGKPIS
jgi:RNA polymerase sigma factor for flagellar operon FliA